MNDRSDNYTRNKTCMNNKSDKQMERADYTRNKTCMNDRSDKQMGKSRQYMKQNLYE